MRDRPPMHPTCPARRQLGALRARLREEAPPPPSLGSSIAAIQILKMVQASTRQADTLIHQRKVRFQYSALLAALVLLFNTPTYAQDPDTGVRLRVGLEAIPVEIRGVRDVHVSDWELYGTGETEGRVALPLSLGLQDAYRYALSMGVSAPYRYGSIITDLAVSPFGRLKYGQITGGFQIPLYTLPSLEFHVQPHLRFVRASTRIGQVKKLENKLSPVITSDGHFYVGDEISASLSGVALGVNGVGVMPISNHSTFFIELGYRAFVMSDVSIRVGGELLKLNSPVVVSPVLDIGTGYSSNEPAEVAPKFSAGGFALSVGASFSWDAAWQRLAPMLPF